MALAVGSFGEDCRDAVNLPVGPARVPRRAFFGATIGADIFRRRDGIVFARFVNLDWIAVEGRVGKVRGRAPEIHQREIELPRVPCRGQFSSATQIGHTTTSKETEYASNIAYFGEPVFTYSLRQGISDGFLAPYKVMPDDLECGVGLARTRCHHEQRAILVLAMASIAALTAVT